MASVNLVLLSGLVHGLDVVGTILKLMYSFKKGGRKENSHSLVEVLLRNGLVAKGF